MHSMKPAQARELVKKISLYVTYSLTGSGNVKNLVFCCIINTISGVIFFYVSWYVGGTQRKFKLVMRRELSPPVAMTFFHTVKWVSGGS